jgi:hypothetical protein
LFLHSHFNLLNILRQKIVEMSLTLEKVEFLSLLEFSLSERRINCKQFSAPKISKENGKNNIVYTKCTKIQSKISFKRKN